MVLVVHTHGIGIYMEYLSTYVFALSQSAMCQSLISVHQKSLVRNAQEGFEQSMNVMMKATQNVSVKP